LVYPKVASPKLDGVRATFVDGVLLTRSLKAIPNRSVASYFKSAEPLDGELIVGDPTSKSCFRDTMKVVSAFEADVSDLRFHIFDIVYEGSFTSRLHAAFACIEDKGDHFVEVPHIIVMNERELLTYEEEALTRGYEGVMLRDPNGKYKFGRSTVREGALLKLKRKETSEATILGFEEQMHNANPQTTNELGYAERTSHQANKIPMNTLGALKVKDLKTGVEFNVGTGFTMAERALIWRIRDTLVGKVVSYEFLPVGVKDKPRHPAFLGFRIKEDIS
jgi:DNA ligase-1